MSMAYEHFFLLGMPLFFLMVLFPNTKVFVDGSQVEGALVPEEKSFNFIFLTVREIELCLVDTHFAG